MNRSSFRFTTHAVFLMATLVVTVLLPATAVHAKTLASKALAAAIENGTLEQVKQELLMDASQKQKFEFDEAGIEELGRKQLGQGNEKLGIEILQINQVIHNTSPHAANALGDGYQAAGDDITARVYYDMALNMDPDNEHARQAIEETDETAEELAMSAMGGMELDADAMQESMAQMGVEMSPEDRQKMQEAMAQYQKFQETGEMPESSTPRPKPQTPQKESSPAPPLPSFDDPQEAMFCESVYRGDNADKKITDPKVRAQFEGEYGKPGDTMRTWNIETICREFLIAVPLWADVSPPLLKQTSTNTFEDYFGYTWVFQMGGDGKATGVIQTSSDGTTTEMKRLGDPRSYD